MSMKKITCLKGRADPANKLIYKQFMDALDSFRFNLKSISLYRDSKKYALPDIAFVYYANGMPHESNEIISIHKQLPANLSYRDSVFWFYTAIVDAFYFYDDFYDYRDDINKLRGLPCCIDDIIGIRTFATKISTLSYTYNGEKEVLSMSLSLENLACNLETEISIWEILDTVKRIKKQKALSKSMSIKMLKNGYAFDVNVNFETLIVETVFLDCKPKFENNFLKINFVQQDGAICHINPIIVIKSSP